MKDKFLPKTLAILILIATILVGGCGPIKATPTIASQVAATATATATATETPTLVPPTAEIVSPADTPPPTRTTEEILEDGVRSPDEISRLPSHKVVRATETPWPVQQVAATVAANYTAVARISARAKTPTPTATPTPTRRLTSTPRSRVTTSTPTSRATPTPTTQPTTTPMANLTCPKCFSAEFANALFVVAGETGISTWEEAIQAMKKDKVTLACVNLEKSEVEFTSGGLMVWEDQKGKILITQGETHTDRDPVRHGGWEYSSRPVFVVMPLEIPPFVEESFEDWTLGVLNHCCTLPEG